MAEGRVCGIAPSPAFALWHWYSLSRDVTGNREMDAPASKGELESIWKAAFSDSGKVYSRILGKKVS